MEKAIVNIKGVDYEIKFTIGFWKKLQALTGITKANLETEIKDNFGETVIKVLYWGIYYGLPVRPAGLDDMPVKESDLEDINTSVIDVIELALINGMTSAEKVMVEKVREFQAKKTEELMDEYSKKK